MKTLFLLIFCSLIGLLLAVKPGYHEKKTAGQLNSRKEQHLSDTPSKHLNRVKRKHEELLRNNNPNPNTKRDREHSVAMEADKKSDHDTKHRNQLHHHHKENHHKTDKTQPQSSKRGNNHHHSVKKVLHHNEKREAAKTAFKHSVKRVERWLEGRGMEGKINIKDHALKTVNHTLNKIQKVMDRQKRNSHKKKLLKDVAKGLTGVNDLKKRGKALKHRMDVNIKENMIKRLESDPRMARNDNNLLKRGINRSDKKMKQTGKDVNGLN